ncbi:MAG: DUF4125 family protein [Olsenella sp.]|jgi:hypothetical protein|nr:DUF4125 family protein [Olsenella sp.]
MGTCACACREGSGSYGRRLERRRAMDALFSAPGVVDVMAGEGLGESARADLRRLVGLEWEQFDAVLGMNGRAGCQDDLRSFLSYRCAQYLAFPHRLIPLVLGEYEEAERTGRNLVEEKYARMMAVTDPDGYQRDWAQRLGTPSPVRAAALRQIRALLSPALEAAARELPQSHRHARPDESAPGRVSALDYFEAELAGYSLGTLFALRDALGEQLKHTNPIALSYVLAARLSKATEAIS